MQERTMHQPEALLFEAPPLLAPTYTSVEFCSTKVEELTEADGPPHAYRNILCMTCGHVITIPVYCGNRFCPICSQPRANRIRQKLIFCVAHQRKLTGCTFKHLTLTIKNAEDLAGMVAHLVKSFRRLRQRKVWKKSVLGGAYVVEVTGGTGAWHAHIHCLLYSHYIPWQDLLKAWKACSGGEHIRINMINARVCAGYLTKYVTKPSEFHASEFDVVNECLRNYRLFNPFGSWYSLAAEYEPPKPGCPSCGGHSWIAQDYLEFCNRYDYAYIQYLMKKLNLDDT